MTTMSIAINALREIASKEIRGPQTQSDLAHMAGVAQAALDKIQPRITSISREDCYGSCTLHATYSNGMEKLLFSYYLDELAFSDADLIGKTENEAHQLRRQRDVAYLQS